jgi:hypothetical protein
MPPDLFPEEIPIELWYGASKQRHGKWIAQMLPWRPSCFRRRENQAPV